MQKADLLIRGGTVIDGTGAARFKADVAIKGDRIEAVGELKNWQADHTLEVEGMIVAPGFIDCHVHHDEIVLSDPDMICALNQGVTTIINGNCGFSIAPLTKTGPLPQPLAMILSRDPDAPRFARFADYQELLREVEPRINAACLIGHGTLRINEVADLTRPADKAELLAMCRALDKALGEGGIGLSTGPFYPPASAAPTEELIEMARVARAHGKLYVTHMRDEGDHGIEALEETLHIGREAHCGVHVSHHKCAGLANHGQSKITLTMIARASSQQDVGLDTTPWIASSTMLNSGRHRQATRVIVSESAPHPECAGRDLAHIAKEWDVDVDTAVDRLLPATGIFFIMDEADVQRILTFDKTLVSSDAIARGEHPHPRTWGTFPRVLGRYVRDLALLSLENAIARMTSMPADRFGICDRGRVRARAFADLVVFDANTVREGATFADPMQYSAGIEHVLVNGAVAWQSQRIVGDRNGHVLSPTSSSHGS